MTLLSPAVSLSLLVLAAQAAAPGAGTEAPLSAKNPLLQPWSGPYAGVPPFDQVKVEQFKPALEAAMAETLAKVDAIAADPAGKLLMAGGVAGVVASRDGGVSYQLSSRREFTTDDVTIPPTWLLCSAEHELEVVSDEAGRD